MEKINLPFGEYVKRRREQLGLTMRALADAVKISPAYLCDIENGNRKPPEKFLGQFAEVLQITEADELNRFYDLAGVGKNGQHSDINSYIDGLPSARLALRTAKDHNFTDEDWQKLIEIIRKRKI